MYITDHFVKLILEKLLMDNLLTSNGNLYLSAQKLLLLHKCDQVQASSFPLNDSFEGQPTVQLLQPD